MALAAYYTTLCVALLDIFGRLGWSRGIHGLFVVQILKILVHSSSIHNSIRKMTYITELRMGFPASHSEPNEVEKPRQWMQCIYLHLPVLFARFWCMPAHEIRGYTKIPLLIQPLGPLQAQNHSPHATHTLAAIAQNVGA